MNSDKLIRTDNRTISSAGLSYITLTKTFGAVVSGLDLSKDIPESVKSALKQALFDHQVLLFRQQALNEDQQIQFAQIFGPCRVHWQNKHYPSKNNLAHYLSNVDTEGLPMGDHPDPGSTHWHSDGSYSRQPSRATVLYGIEVPVEDGATHFANMYQVYEDLDQSLKVSLQNLYAEHNFELARATRQRRMPRQWLHSAPDRQSLLMQLKWWKGVMGGRFRNGAVYHPVVRMHPVTGRPALFIGDHAWRIASRFWPAGIKMMKEINSLEFSPAAIYTHKWQPGDLLIWDNGSVLHRVGPYDIFNQVRIMRRCVVEN
jgi:taurine dioxygenase